MLIDKLVCRQRQQVAQLAEQGHQQQQLLLAHSRLLRQCALIFIGSAPGLTLSFSAGVLFQLRHNSSVKTVRRLVGLRWIRLLY